MRLSKEDWLKGSLSILIQYGPEAIKIDNLCSVLKVTKGSFYHHFQNREVFVNSLLDHWQQENTKLIIDEVNQYDNPHLRGEVIDHLARNRDTDSENAIRACGHFDPLVAQRVKIVDEQRLGFLQKLIAKLITTDINVNLIAKMSYAHFIGAQQLNQIITPEEWRAMDNLLQSLLFRQGSK